MSHLSTERLAALADERPTTDERLHLTQCAACARELDAHRSLLAMAESERDAMQLPLTRWDSLSERLRAEGLVVGRGARDAGPGWRTASQVALRVAAALLLVAGGMAVGRRSVGAPAIPGFDDGQQTPVARTFSYDSLPTSFASVEDANRWRMAYADAYQRTVSFLAASDTGAPSTETPAVMRARLSALDRVFRTMREALDEAPYDPVINDFYLNSFGQREATLRQLNTVLPQGVRLNSF